MNPRELVDHIRSGPAELVLDEPLRFRRRTRSNPCDFNEFLQALQTSETIRSATCRSHRTLGITEDEWVLLVKTIGRIKDIHNLRLYCDPGSRNFHPFQAVADAVSNAHSLRNLLCGLLEGETFPRDPSGLTALANVLQEHTTLQEFTWVDRSPRAPQGLSTGPVLRVLPACPHLRKFTIMATSASADAIRNLLQLPKDTHLRLALNIEQWLALADGIRQGHCNIKHLYIANFLSSSSKDTEAVKAMASAIRLDHNLEHLTLRMENGFTDEAGVVLAEALTVNKTLCKMTLRVEPLTDLQVGARATLGAPAYEALSAMLRVNTSLVLSLPPFNTGGADERLRESKKQMIIEQRLNQVGRGRLLASRQTTREEYVDALYELNSYVVDDSPAFQVSCLYSLLLLNPSVVCMS
jgi:hypothetical protein